jgi:hypothetical protein
MIKAKILQFLSVFLLINLVSLFLIEISDVGIFFIHSYPPDLSPCLAKSTRAK